MKKIYLLLLMIPSIACAQQDQNKIQDLPLNLDSMVNLVSYSDLGYNEQHISITKIKFVYKSKIYDSIQEGKFCNYKYGLTEIKILDNKVLITQNSKC